jgi:hypothetical protein
LSHLLSKKKIELKMAKFDGILIESFWFFLIPECHIDKLKYFLTQKKLEKSFETFLKVPHRFLAFYVFY